MSDPLFACPYCGAPLRFSVVHSCPGMRDDIGVPTRRTGRAAGAYLVVVGVLMTLTLIYLGAHLLVALGVGGTC